MIASNAEMDEIQSRLQYYQAAAVDLLCGLEMYRPDLRELTLDQALAKVRTERYHLAHLEDED